MIDFIVTDAQDFRSHLPESGVFEMYDVVVLLEASDFTPVSEIEEISTFLHAAINVVDFKVKKADFSDIPEIRVSITEVPLHVAENRKPRNPRP